MSPDFQDLVDIFRAHNERIKNDDLKLIEAVKTSGVPLPQDLADQIANLLNPSRSALVLHAHPGYAVSELRSSYRISLSIAQTAFDDLMHSIGDFQEFAVPQRGLFRNSEAELFERKVQKEIFATTNAAASLVDHSRRLQRVLNVASYNQVRSEIFQDDFLHDFIIGLRVLLHHLHIAQATWSVATNFIESTTTATFNLHKAKLMNILKALPERFPSDGPVYKFIESQSDDIDLRVIFDDYRKRVMAFAEWFTLQISQSDHPELTDYDRLMELVAMKFRPYINSRA